MGSGVSMSHIERYGCLVEYLSGLVPIFYNFVHADDEELQCYLLQLVQALRFERSDKSRLSNSLSSVVCVKD
jgi:hypothetical protein